MMENALELIKTRRSTRKFKPDMLEENLLSQLLEAGRFAPSGGNNQSTHFFVVKSQKVLDTLRDIAQEEFAKMEVYPGMYRSLVNSVTAAKRGGYVFHYDCPVLIITANKKDYGNNIADCSCALENMMIMANSLDLGSCWINQLKWLNENPRILEYMKSLGLAEDERVYGALAVGYPDTGDGLPNRVPVERKGNPVTVIE